MEELWIRPMKVEDIDEVLKIERLCFSTPWSREAFRAEIEGNHCARYLVAELGGLVVGFGGMWIILDEAHITNIGVHPHYRGRGIGEAIMRGLIETASRLKVEGMTLEVRVSNVIAQNLYKKLGFVSVGVRKGYYSDNGEDALIMWRNKYTKV
ncbi:MAG: ribosomal protein S18-alanine N-acetyltransferase [Caldicoprobacterales bacterium]|jgi:ribosomal-protein-alanine N-acetyltransferase|nr:ribosomal protein S18-alanine N-acetyltransferase [Clostridiales bacterium]